MKKLVLLFLMTTIALSIHSCSKDNDTQTQDQLIGKWQSYEMIIDGIVDANYWTECDLLGTFELKLDGATELINYDDYGNGCEIVETEIGTWAYLGNSIYLFKNQDEINNDLEGRQQKITFVNNDTIYSEMSIGNVTYRIMSRRIN